MTTVFDISRRELLKAGASGIAATMLSPLLMRQALAAEVRFNPLPPISVMERKARVAKLQALMRKRGLGALLLEPGSSMLFFTGIDWWRSERLTAVVIPADGEIGVVTPYFEEPSVRESLAFGDDVRTWNEDENPLQLVHGILADRGTLERPHVQIGSRAAANVTCRRYHHRIAACDTSADRGRHDARRHRRHHGARDGAPRRHPRVQSDPARRGERLSARVEEAAARDQRRGGTDGLRLQLPGLSVRHLTHVRLR